MELSTNNESSVSEQAELERDKFEMAMTQAGWKPKKDVFGGITGWKCRYRTVRDKYAFDYFRASGNTPVRML